ncbi:MAG TPA: competence/damage-inducible protein A [Deltaproteobacteria bacterium]|nr:competence/damage-inducible protein A [Deltaproteobacteria bacterium]
MKVGILTIGDELTHGMIQDTNSFLISREVTSERWHVTAIMAVGDDGNVIRDALKYLMERSDAVIVTGGLGPTADDKTTMSIARTFGLGLYTDESVLRHIKERFEKFRIAWTENNTKQAVFPQGAIPLYNPIGTAWGFSLKKGGKIIAVVPGVPAEVKRMVPQSVIPLLRAEFPEAVRYSAKRTIKLFGISEAKIDETIAGAGMDIPGISIGFYPRFPENHLVITSQGDDESSTLRNLDRAVARAIGRMKKYVFGYDDATLEGIVAALLTEKGLTLSVAESCTGGLITDRLTNIPGSSLFFDRGIIAYSNGSKMELLEVPAAVLERHGAVSEETAVLMARGVRKLGKTDVGLATTGIAGPTGGSEAKPVGTVFVAVAGEAESVCRTFHFRWDRRRIKEITSQWALEILRRFIVEGGAK